MAKVKQILMNGNKSTRVVKQNPVSKPSKRIYTKQLLMKQRRINALIEERSSLEDKNRELLDSVKAEKMLTSSLRKENFQLQRLYHESVISLNSYKVQQNELIQALSLGIREYDAVYPHLVALSETVASNKVRLTNMLHSLRSSEQYFPKQFVDSGRENDSARRNANPKQRVGPMVRGMLITKPKIMLQRVMLPQPQEQGQVNNNMNHIEVNNQLTPIPEENDREERENLDMRGIAVRPRHKLGKSWLRRQEKLERERGKESPKRVSYSGDSTDTESNSAAMEPVVRFRDVSRLLQNSSLLKVDNNRAGDGDGGGGNNTSRQSKNESNHLSGNLKRTAEDPLEGSSWMFTNSFRQSRSSGRSSSLYKSDSSSDDDNEILHTQKNDSCVSVKNTLVLPPNNTFTIASKNRHSSPETSNDTTEGSPAEPDSTNNIDDQHFSFNGSSFENDCRNSSSSSVSANRSSIRTSSDYNLRTESQTAQRISINTNSLTVRLSKVPEISALSSNCGLSSNKRHSSFCNNWSPIPNSPEVVEVVGKRIRKPKKQLYPGEEDSEASSKSKMIKPVKLSVGRKSLEKRKVKKRSSLDKRSNGTTVNSARSSNVGNESSGSGKKSTNKIKENTAGNGKKVKSKNSLSQIVNSTSLNNGRQLSLGSKKSISNTKENAVGTEKKKKSTKSSLFSGMNSSISNGHQQSLGVEDTSSRPKRGKSNVCYKESPLNVKQRRP